MKEKSSFYWGTNRSLHTFSELACLITVAILWVGTVIITSEHAKQDPRRLSDCPWHTGSRQWGRESDSDSLSAEPALLLFSAMVSAPMGVVVDEGLGVRELCCPGFCPPPQPWHSQLAPKLGKRFL